MLRSLHIENIAVVRQVDIDFSEGFSALTGETGAGKSIIIDSINLLMGNRGTREMIRTGETHALVSGVFDSLSADAERALEEMGIACDDHALFLQKTLSADGRGTSRVNGRAITAAMQKEIGRLLLNIHGQNDSQKLLQKSSHLRLLDAYAHPTAQTAAYSAVYEKLRRIEKEKANLCRGEAEKLRLREILAYQISDIDGAHLQEGEEEKLIAERDRLANLEKILRQVSGAVQMLTGGENTPSAVRLLGKSAQALSSVAAILPRAGELAERLYAMQSEAEDIAAVAGEFVDVDAGDPTAKIDRIEGRLDIISKMKRKYGSTIGEILEFRRKAKEQLNGIENADEKLAALVAQEAEIRAQAEKAAAELSAVRMTAAREIETKIRKELEFLDMPRVRFEIASIPTADFTPTGRDDVEFMIATNAGEPLLPLIRIASGGELSRMMLAMRAVLSDKDGIGTVIFDEVDTGISGKTSRKVGIKLRDIAADAQVICVTHSAQIASLADKHYFIAKADRQGRTETSVSLLEGAERVEEIARILGGLHVTEVQRKAAAEMIVQRGNI